LRCSLSSSPVAGAAAAIGAGDEQGRDGEQIIAELATALVRRLLCTVNHELRALRCKDSAHEVKGEATESVPVQDHHSSDMAVENSLQKGRTREPAADVLVDAVARVRLLERRDLAVEVGPLVGAGHARA
jgi:hypothetical protein